MSVWIVALAGVVATIGAPFVYDWAKARLASQDLEKHKQLLGAWHSTWQTNSSSGPSWVTEVVDVTVDGDALRFSNRSNSANYEWSANVKVVRGCFLHGAWKSRIKDSSKGAVVLLHTDSGPNLHGDAMVGFFLGPNESHFSSFGALVLARTSGALDGARLRLAEVGPALHEIFKPVVPPHTGTQ